MLSSFQRRPRLLQKDCFHLNNSCLRNFPSRKWLPKGWRLCRWGGGGLIRQIWQILSRESLRGFLWKSKKIVRNPVSCSMVNILVTEGETEACFSTQSELKRRKQKSLHGQWQTKLTAWGWERNSMMGCKKALISLQVTFRDSQKLNFYSSGYL